MEFKNCSSDIKLELIEKAFFNRPENDPYSDIADLAKMMLNYEVFLRSTLSNHYE